MRARNSAVRGAPVSSRIYSSENTARSESVRGAQNHRKWPFVTEISEKPFFGQNFQIFKKNNKIGRTENPLLTSSSKTIVLIKIFKKLPKMAISAEKSVLLPFKRGLFHEKFGRVRIFRFSRFARFGRNRRGRKFSARKIGF